MSQYAPSKLLSTSITKEIAWKGIDAKQSSNYAGMRDDGQVWESTTSRLWKCLTSLCSFCFFRHRYILELRSTREFGVWLWEWSTKLSSPLTLSDAHKFFELDTRASFSARICLLCPEKQVSSSREMCTQMQRPHTVIRVTILCIYLRESSWCTTKMTSEYLSLRLQGFFVMACLQFLEKFFQCPKQLYAIGLCHEYYSLYKLVSVSWLSSVS